jgi:hypothetical protein
MLPCGVDDLRLTFRDSLPGGRRWTTADGKKDVVLEIAVGEHG